MKGVLRSAACAVAAAAALVAKPLAAQTFQPERAVDVTACAQKWYGTFCGSARADRLGSNFTQAQFGRKLFGRGWSTATHCTRYSTSEGQCERSVSVGSDPRWGRVVWGRNGSFLAAYGTSGVASEGPGRLLQPLGVDITLRTGNDYHVAYVADAGNNRVVVLALNTATRAVQEVGFLDGSESGTPLRYPADVAWDPVGTPSMTDDRVFIADSKNNRIVVYSVNVDPATGTMTKTYRTSFGSAGSGPNQLLEPMGVEVTTRRSPAADVPMYTDIYVSDGGNRRVALWRYDGGTSTSAAPPPYSSYQSAPIAGAELMGITQDAYGDVIVADRAGNHLVRLAGSDLQLLKTYGGGYSWQDGNFNHPSDVHVIRSYTVDQFGHLVDQALPHVETVEEWTPTTGGQLHQLGVDVEQLQLLQVQLQSVHDLRISFVLTGAGQYQALLYGPSGALVRSWATEYAYGGGARTVYWDGKDAAGQNAPAGRYRLEIRHESAYTYDNGQPRVTSQQFDWGFYAGIDAPAMVTTAGTYSLLGTASRDAAGWAWQRQDRGSSGNASGFYAWDNRQNSSAMIYPEFDTTFIDWLLTVVDYGGNHATAQVSTQVLGTAGESGGGGVGGGPGGGIGGGGGGGDIPTMTSRAPAPAVVRAKGVLGAGAGVALPNGTRRDHFGAGAWVGRPTGAGPQVVQLYSMTGNHEAAGEWPNALAGAAETVLETAPGRSGRASARAVFRRQGGAAEREAYAVRFGSRAAPGEAAAAGSGFVALALDPDLGARASDDRLGVDEATGLVWVADPDSGAVGYVVTDLPRGARVSVRQFSLASASYYPDAASDSAAYAELAAGENRLTGRPGDARFVIAVGAVELSRDVELGLVVLRARSLDELRELAARVPRTGVVTARGASGTGITRFHLAQAPPEPGAPAGVRSVSPASVAGLDAGPGERAPAAPSLRDIVRREGITALAFAVPDGAPARVKVAVYDARGRLVRRLVDEVSDPGAYRVQWDGVDDRGGRAAAGVYVAVMEAPGFRATTRLVVVP